MTLPWKRTNTNLTTRSNRFDSPIQQLFDDFFPDFATPLLDRNLLNFVPKVNMAEKDTEYKITAELPGVEEKDVDVTIDDNILRIRGEKREEQSDARFSRYESTYGAFERVIQLPMDVDPESVNAEFKNGLLTLTIPKQENPTRSRKIPINTSRDDGQREPGRTRTGKESSRSVRTEESH